MAIDKKNYSCSIICFWRNISSGFRRWSSLQTKKGQMRSENLFVWLQNRLTPSTSNDTVIIKRTIGLVLGPFKALYRSFLNHCTPTNKGTIWRHLPKPPQRIQGLDPCPLRLLVGTPSVLWPELGSRRAEHSLLWLMPLYIFDILFYHLTGLCNNCYGLSAVGCWSSGLHKEDYLQIKFLNVCPFDYKAFVVSGKVGIP